MKTRPWEFPFGPAQKFRPECGQGRSCGRSSPTAMSDAASPLARRRWRTPEECVMRIRAKIGELTVERLHVTQAPEPKAEIKAALRTQDRRQIRRRCAGGCEVAERTGVERRWRSIDVELAKPRQMSSLNAASSPARGCSLLGRLRRPRLAGRGRWARSANVPRPVQPTGRSTGGGCDGGHHHQLHRGLGVQSGGQRRPQHP